MMSNGFLDTLGGLAQRILNRRVSLSCVEFGTVDDILKSFGKDAKTMRTFTRKFEIKGTNPLADDRINNLVQGSLPESIDINPDDDDQYVMKFRNGISLDCTYGCFGETTYVTASFIVEDDITDPLTPGLLDFIAGSKDDELQKAKNDCKWLRTSLENMTNDRDKCKQKYKDFARKIGEITEAYGQLEDAIREYAKVSTCGDIKAEAEFIKTFQPYFLSSRDKV